MSHVLYQFSGNHLGAIEWCEPRRGETLVADSWRVDDGQVVALEHHLDRFRTSVASTTELASAPVEAFLAAVLHKIQPVGSWFPRIEAVATPGGPTLRYRHRVAPELTSEAILASTSQDPRTHPLVKGPDLEALLRLRSNVAPLGATEAVILDAQGAIVEGAYSSVVVWTSGSDVLTIVPRSTPRLPGITEQVVLDSARREGVSVEERTLFPQDLDNATVWILSALHGIRQATAWVDGPTLSRSQSLRDAWREKWRDEGQGINQLPR